uniref:Elongator complex protein 2 n=1 Tax=Denticeps clupeoides TaxID=299321 RepID=A0AAY4ENK9_9TELE
MAAPVVETCHVACGANGTPHVLSWSRRGLVAFGTCHSVALYDPQKRNTVALLNRHSARVNAVQWVRRQDCGPESKLISGSSDHSVIIWEELNGTVCCAGHTGPVCAVDAVLLGRSKLLVASAASDSTVKLWLTNEGKVECLQTLTFGSGFMMDVSLTLLPGSGVAILACGGDDCKLHHYVQQNGQFKKVLSLQGHEDWIRGVEWTTRDGELWLASCAQDCLIRVWRLFAKLQGTTSLYAMTLETVLAGHENWVYGIHWQPSYIKDETVHQPLSLLSASMDKTMILWGPEDASGVWVEQVRVGEVGGNTLGFYGCQMSPDGHMILAHAFHGALHLWHRDPNQEWSPAVIVSGHFDAVQDLSWDPEGDYIVTVGLDQTTRLFTPWRRKGWAQPTWHEISRPQIHGYDMQCLAMVGRFQFVSGADEKVLRVFRAPRNFVENFANIAGRPLEELLSSSDSSDMPEGASTPALGLSNKAVFQGDLVSQKSEDNAEDSSRVSDQYKESYFQPLSLNGINPSPQIHIYSCFYCNKLNLQLWYGHGFEMFCLASDSTRTVVASACKASKAEHASILLWSSSSWKQLQSLPCHSLTVTQMSFSPDARLLLAVSRDRTWSLWKREDPPSGNPLFSLYTHTKKETAVHARIIWSCDWSADNKYFVTSSRDKKVIVWGHGASGDPVGEGAVAIGPCSSVLDVGDSATAVAFCPFPCADHSYLLAVGLEGGRILLYKWRPMAEPSAASDWTRCGQTDDSQSHSLAVKRLRWRSRPGLAGQQGAELDHSWVQLASAGVDHALKIFNVHLQAL